VEEIGLFGVIGEKSRPGDRWCHPAADMWKPPGVM